MNDDLMARTGQTSPFGKCTDPLELFIPAPIAEGLIGYGVLSGCRVKSENVRNFIQRRLFGRLSELPGATVKDGEVVIRKTSLIKAIEGYAFMLGIDADELVLQVLCEEFFGAVHVLKNGCIGTDGQPAIAPEELPGIRQIKRSA